jgi:hypothetical protein
MWLEIEILHAMLFRTAGYLSAGTLHGYQENQREDCISDETWKVIEERKRTKIRR